MLQSKQEDLIGKTVEELRKICKENGISIYKNGKRINKAEMIDKLLDVIEKENNDMDMVEEVEEERKNKKRKYIEKATIGTIVAFKLDNGKVISAAIAKKSTKGRKFMVETKYGVEHKISFDDVLWVKTNKRWPKGIYQLFKKNIKVEVLKDGKEIN